MPKESVPGLWKEEVTLQMSSSPRVLYKQYRTLYILFLLLISALAGCASSAATEGDETAETVTVERGPLSTSITALGSIRPGAEVVLSFEGAGRVYEVFAQAGKRVDRDQPLAHLDTSRLELQVRSAEAALSAAQAQLDQVQAGPKAQEIRVVQGQLAAAQAALDQAIAQRDQLITGTQKSEIEVAEAQLASAQARVRQLERQHEQLRAQDPGPEVAVVQVDVERAKIALDETQDEYNKALDRPWEDQEIRDSWAKELQQAQLGYRQAQAQLERAQNNQRAYAISLQALEAQIEDAQAAVRAAQAGLVQTKSSAEPQRRGAESSVAAARAQQDIAQAQLDLLLSGATAAEIAAAQAQVDQAQVVLDSALLELERATLRAPFEGTVSWIDIEPGQYVSSQTPAVTLVNDRQFSIEADVDEADIGWLQVGQEVLIALDAFPGRSLTGHIAAILPSATTDLGVVFYRVTIALDPDAPESDPLSLRGGMTADAEIVREQREDVLLIPNRAIWIDAQSGRPFVERDLNGEVVVTFIEQGLTNDEFSEVTSGLQEGDRLRVPSASIRDRFREVVTSSMTGQ
jgi:HlyD family secretion protein